MNRNRDGRIGLKVSDSFLSVTCSFFPPDRDGKPITMDYVRGLLDSERIVFGVNWSLLETLILKCNIEKIRIENIEIATGRKPRKEIPPYLKLEKKFFENRQNSFGSAKPVDYKNLSPFFIVRKKEVIAHIIPPKQGIPGMDIYGKEIPPGKKDIIQFVPGENTRLVDGKVIAICDGLFVEKGNRFWINEVLELKNGVDYHTGHIKFPGDVVIDGDVKDDFKIYSGGSIYCKKTLDATLVVCKKDLNVVYGILGKNTGVVRAGGNIEARFVENCIVKAGGKLSVRDSILDSAVYAFDILEMGDRGSIIGGTIQAVNGITAYQIGNGFGVNTIVQCGVDFMIEQKLDQVREKILELKKKKADQSGNDREKERLEESIKIMSDYINKTQERVIKNKNSRIRVTGRTFPGTTVDICHRIITIEKEVDHVVFCLDQTTNKIVMEKIS